MDSQEKLHEFVEKAVSILIDVNKNSVLKESYSGIIKEVGDDYVILDTNNKSSKWKIKDILFKKKIILSVWIYKKDAFE